MTFREETILICYLQVFFFAPVEFQSSFQDLNFVRVLLLRGNLALITRDPFQPLKGLLRPNLIGFVRKKFSPMTSWSRDQQVPAKNAHVDFQIWPCFQNNIQKLNLGLGKVLDGWSIYPA